MSSGSQPAGTLDRLAQEVFERLSRDDDEAGMDNPQAYLERHVAEVQNQWRAADIDTCTKAADEHELREYLRSAVDELPPRQRSALLLHAREDLTPAQIASRQSWPKEMVIQDLVSAYSRLLSLMRTRFPDFGA